MAGQHGTSLHEYTQALTVQLRLRKVPVPSIGQIVAEVESHVRETGEDPIEAFGQPGIYSAQCTCERASRGRRVRSGLLDAAVPTVAITGALMILESLSSLTGVFRVTGNMPPFWFATGLVFALVMRRGENVVADWGTRAVGANLADRRTRPTGASRQVWSVRAAHWLYLLILGALIALARAIRSQSPEGPELLHLPGWALLLVGLTLLVACGWLDIRRTDKIVDPRSTNKEGGGSMNTENDSNSENDSKISSRGLPREPPVQVAAARRAGRADRADPGGGRDVRCRHRAGPGRHVRSAGGVCRNVRRCVTPHGRSRRGGYPALHGARASGLAGRRRGSGPDPSASDRPDPDDIPRLDAPGRRSADLVHLGAQPGWEPRRLPASIVRPRPANRQAGYAHDWKQLDEH